jgi:hypothetical protein
MRQKLSIDIKRENDGFTALVDGRVLDIDQIATIVDIMKDELEAAFANNPKLNDRRLAIFENDQKKGTSDYKGASKLAKEWGVSIGTILYDRTQNEKHRPVKEPEEAPQEGPVIEDKPVKKPGKKNGKRSKKSLSVSVTPFL